MNHYEELLGRLSYVVDEQVGIIKYIIPGVLSSTDPPIHSYACAMADTRAFFNHKCNERNGGAGFSYEQAITATIGEGIERYCAAIYNMDEIVFASWKELKDRALHPSRWALFSKKQYNKFKKIGLPYKEFTEDLKVSWVKGWYLVKEESVYVPAQFVYIPFARQREEVPIGPSISTGMSFGSSLEEAILYGLLENFEREALSIWWMQMIPYPNVVIDEDYVEEFLNYFKNVMSPLWIKYLYTEFGIPVIVIIGVMSVLFPDGKRHHALVMGSAARLSAIKAYRKALLELGQTFPFYRYIAQSFPKDKQLDRPENIWDFDDHPRWWYLNTEKYINSVKIWVEKGNIKNLSELPDYDQNDTFKNLDFLKNLLSEKGYDPVIIDLTTPEISDLGFKVVKVMIPEFVPLEGGHLLRHLGAERLYKVPKNLGYEVFNEDEVNPLPHPSA